MLGESTLRRLHKRIGDSVTFGPERRPVLIVGTAVLPAIGQGHSSHPSPGEGAVVLFAEAEVDAGAASDPSEGPAFPASVVAIRFRSGADTALAEARLREATSGIGAYPGSSEFLELARPAEIVNARSFVRLPTLTAAILTVAALASLSIALAAGVRRRRTDLAVLRAIGFTRRQSGASILTQSTIVAAVGIIIGAPLGVVAGRWSWSRFANRMSVDPSPQLPLGSLALVIVGLAIGAILVAVTPSQMASRIRAGDVLRRG
jgi:hypothetical protein